MYVLLLLLLLLLSLLLLLLVPGDPKTKSRLLSANALIKQNGSCGTPLKDGTQECGKCDYGFYCDFEYSTSDNKCGICAMCL